MRAMRILHATSELFPYSKTGGLADMVAGLTGALAGQGHEVAIATPLYRGIREQFPELEPPGSPFKIKLGKNQFTGRCWKLKTDAGTTVLFLENDGFYNRPGIYLHGGDGYWDNPERFMFLSKAVASMAGQFDIVHVHDWQTAFVPMLLKCGRFKKAPPTVLTIHNLAYQGSCEGDRFAISNLPQKHFHQEGPEYWGSLNYLKAGLHYADSITTVSPQYAKEILTAEFGEGMEGVLRSRGRALVGILNGVDYSEWRTEGNPHLAADYSADDLSGKEVCKAGLLNEIGIPEQGLPLFGVVSRLAEQKGVSLLVDALKPFLADEKLQLVVLGDGEAQWVDQLKSMEGDFPDLVSANIKYDDGLAHRIEAGSNFFLMPSRFEPCGLNQLYSLRYGAIPIVHAVGGLEDTVIDFREHSQNGTGIKFRKFESQAFAESIAAAIQLYGEPKRKIEVIKQGMEADYSWAKSSSKFADLYQTAQNRT